MKKYIGITVGLLLLFSIPTYSQYNFAVGVRSGGTSGITLKSLTSSLTAVEGIIGFWNDGLSFTGLYERHPQAFGAEGFHWILGMGGHVALYESNFRGANGPAWYSDYPDGIDDGSIGIGIDAIAGLEFKFPVVPLAISFDLKPFLEFTTSDNIWVSLDPGLGIKLAF